jgi:hypothetical protein
VHLKATTSVQETRTHRLGDWQRQILHQKVRGSVKAIRAVRNTRVFLSETRVVADAYAPVGKLTTFRYLISHIGRYGSNIDQLDVVTAFLNPEIDDDDIYMTLPERSPQGPSAPKIAVILRKALYWLKHDPRLWHDDIDAFLLSLGFTQSSAVRKVYFRSNGILILLYVNDISMSYPDAGTNATIEVNMKLSEMFKIKNLGPVCQFLCIEIYRDANVTGISLRQTASITTILKCLGMEHSHGISTPIDHNIKLDLAEDRGRRNWKLSQTIKQPWDH